MKPRIRWPKRRLAKGTFLVGLMFLILLTFLIGRQFICSTSSTLLVFNHEQKNSVGIPPTTLYNQSHSYRKLSPNVRLKKKVAKRDFTFYNATFHCNRDGIITVKSGGRLGNLMGEYATLLALAKRDGLFPILQERTSNTLNKYFSHISIPSVRALKCSLNWTSLNLRSYNLLDKKQKQQLAKNGIFIEGYPTSVSLFNRHREMILKEFTFKPSIVLSAQNKLRKLLNDRKNYVSVGIHVRRTDYKQFLKGRFNAQLVGASYFRRAMEIYRQKFPSVVFVVASDDLPWCRANLQSVNDDIVYAGNGDPLNPAEDMALLASCNHSIITYGNFGFWSAYLAGGHAILAGNLSHTPTELMYSIQSANISGWQFIPGL